jgi:drug/metabolite transporter (DMT)-like permease
MIDRLAPALFVLLWSTGWIVAKYASLHGDPLTFLAARHGISILVFLGLCLITRARWPTDRASVLRAIFSGMFLHGFYLAGLWWAIGQGVPAGISGIIAALQPLLTAMAAPLLIGEQLRPIQRAGLGLGFVGILLAISPKLLALDGQNLMLVGFPLLVNLIAMVSVTYGTLYQKQHLQHGDLRSIVLLQYVGAFLVTLPMALLLENLRFDWSTTAIASMVWAVLGLSMGAVSLLFYLIRRGQVSKAASLIYLVPPAVAIEAFLVFGEPLTLPMILGTVIVVAGVYLVNRKQAPAAAMS